MSVISSLADVDPRSLIGKGRVGLLDSTGTYDVDRYAWAYEFWKRQQQTHWMGEEVPLGADLKDWASDRVTPNERALLTQIFRFFTQSDIEVGDNYLKRYIPIFQPLAVQMMMAAFTNMETVHVDAYALLLKTLGMPKTEFEAFRDYAEMRAKPTTCMNSASIRWPMWPARWPCSAHSQRACLYLRASPCFSTFRATIK